MKILIAPDKFKGSLSAQEVCNALTLGLKSANPMAEIIARPMADGGDGSLAVLEHYLNLETVVVSVQDPLFRPINAAYKMVRSTAYIELSAASGLVLLKETERNCRLTSTFGTGELIADALAKGAKEIFLFIGGSATNDGGIGIAAALGYRFYDTFNNLLAPIGENLLLIDRIDDSQVIFDTQEVLIKVVCDVTNPLYGKDGAAYIYGPQKGANQEDIIYLDRGLVNLAARLVAHDFSKIGDIAGAGAAGGVGGGAIAFLDAQLISGINTFLKIAELEQAIARCDLIITGEGKLDAQTEQGKVISGVCKLAKKYNKSVIAVCGAIEKDFTTTLGLQQVYTILERTESVQVAMAQAKEELIKIGELILRNM